MIRHLLKITFRHLTKQKGRSIISVLCITVGLLCFSLCGYYYHILQRGNRSFETYERMAQIGLEGHPEYLMNIPITEIDKLGKDEIEAIASYYNSSSNSVETESGNIFQIPATCCNRDYFTVFPSRIIEGKLDEFDKRPEIIVVTDVFLKQYAIYANEKATIGSVITINKKNYTIGAVIKPYPAGMNGYIGSYDLFIPKEKSFGNTVLLLNSPAAASILNKRITQVGFMQDKDTYHVYLFSQLPQSSGLDLWISLIGLIVLLVALINYFSSSIGNFANRIRELSLRRYMGGRTDNIFFILFCEQFIILSLSCTLALALSESLLPMIFNIMDYETKRNFEIEIPILLRNELISYLILLIVSFCLCYITVAHIIYKMHKKGLSGKRSKGKHVLRNISLTLQFFFSLLFLIGIMGVHFQMKSYSQSANPMLTDEEKENIILLPTASYEDKIHKNLPELCDYFRSRSWCQSLSLFSFNTMNIKGNYIIVNMVTEEFLDQMRVERKHHHGESFAYITPDFEKIRKDTAFSTIKYYDGREYPIVGICRIYPSVNYGVPYLTLLPLNENNEADKIILQLKPGVNRQQALKEISEKINPYYPANIPYKETTLYDEETGFLNILRALFMICTVISILITVLGIYHSIQIDTERRQKEVAIRKINGAQIRHIYWLFGKHYLVLYLLAAALTIPLCIFFMTMASHTIKFDYHQPLLWSVPLIISAIVIVATISWRILRIARINPAEVIKNE